MDQTPFVELWKPVVGYEGWYEVSSEGRVRRILPGRGAIAGRVLRPQANGVGYGWVALWRDGFEKRFYVHRLVLSAFRGPPMYREANHIDGCPGNNRLANLEWVTAAENNKHAYRTGLHKPTPQRKLTETDVAVIRAAKGETMTALGARLGVHRQTIANVLSGRLYRRF